MKLQIGLNILTVTSAFWSGCAHRKQLSVNQTAEQDSGFKRVPIDPCQSPLADGLFQVKSSLASAQSQKLFDLCEPLFVEIDAGLSQKSSTSQRLQAVGAIPLKNLAAAPGYTFIRNKKLLNQQKADFVSVTGSATQKIIINIVNISVQLVGAEKDKIATTQQVEVDVWSGHEAMVAAMQSGIKTLGELAAKVDIEILWAGWRAASDDAGVNDIRKQERWDHMVSAAGVDFGSVQSNYEKAFADSKWEEGTIKVNAEASNFLLGSRTSMGALLNTALRNEAGPIKVGMAFGTFDPPHKGHMELCFRAIRYKKLDECILLPNYSAGHKPGATSIQHRVRMTELASLETNAEGLEKKLNVHSGDPSFIMSRFGIGVFFERMQNLYGTEQVWSLIGDDAYVGGVLKQGLLQPGMKMKYFVNPRSGTDPNSIHVPNYVRDEVEISREGSPDEGLSSTQMRGGLKKDANTVKDAIGAAVIEYICSQNPPLYDANCADKDKK